MSCWVVPSIAAELWGVGVNHVLEQIRIGRVPTRCELGFTLVDVAPGGPRVEPHPTNWRPPQTYTPVAAEEPLKLTPPEAPPALPPTQADPALDFDWRQARRQVGRMRLRPTVGVTG